MEPPRASSSDWLTSEYVLCLYLGIWDPKMHLMGQQSRRRAHALQCTTAGPYNAIPSDFLRDDLRAALVSTYLGSVSSALLRGLERLPIRTHLPSALRSSVQLVNTTVFPFSPLHPSGINSFLETSMAHSTLEAHESVRR